MSELNAENGAPKASGWQQPPLPRPRRTCPHLGLLFANMTAHLHAEGHKWVCSCGQVFVVVSNGGNDKKLVPDWRTPPAKTLSEGVTHATGGGH